MADENRSKEIRNVETGSTLTAILVALGIYWLYRKYKA